MGNSSYEDGLKIAAAANAHLPLRSARLGDEYFYQSLSLCVIDAVFSINVRYASVQNVVERYCRHFCLTKFRLNREITPPPESQESLGNLCNRFEQLGAEAMTGIFKNLQRTSPTNGILKSEATYRFAKVLHDNGIECFQDCENLENRTDIEQSITKIPGQKSGLSFKYFLMLCGGDELIKADRMILRFLEHILRRTVTMNEAQELLTVAAAHLKGEFPEITPRMLDHEIWKFERRRLKR